MSIASPITAERFPFTAYPSGWFVVATSEELVAGDAPPPPAADGIVCSCNQVIRAEIDDAIRARALRTVAQVGSATRAATGCGSCARDVQAMLDEHSSARNTPGTAGKSPVGRMAA